MPRTPGNRCVSILTADSDTSRQVTSADFRLFIVDAHSTTAPPPLAISRSFGCGYRLEILLKNPCQKVRIAGWVVPLVWPDASPAPLQ
jgi:hypothetical protein